MNANDSKPANPQEGDTYKTPGGIEYMWINGAWHQMTARKPNTGSHHE